MGGWSPCKVPRYWASNLSGSILRVGDKSRMCGALFHKGVSFRVGEGNRVPFLVGDWVGVGLSVQCRS